MTATLITIGTLKPNAETHLEQYAQAVIPLLKAAGVKIRGRYKGVETLVGERRPDLVAVMDFPSVDAIKQFFSSDAYQVALVHRHQAFHTLQTFIAEALPSGDE